MTTAWRMSLSGAHDAQILTNERREVPAELSRGFSRQTAHALLARCSLLLLLLMVRIRSKELFVK